MTLTLHIRLPPNLVVEDMLKQANIPCFCRVKGNSSFELDFQSPLPTATGTVAGWTQNSLNERAPAGGGGEYTHYCFGAITLAKGSSDVYPVMGLSFFLEPYGWCSIVQDGQLAEPSVGLTDEEENAIEAMFPLRRGNKKRQRLVAALKKDKEDST